MMARHIPVVLRLAPSSKYGRGEEASDHEVIFRNRGPAQNDLDQDYLRVILPAGVVSDDGSDLIQVNRHDPQSVLGFDAPRDCLVALPGDSFFANLMRALAAQWAVVGLMSAFALFPSVTGNAGVTLLGTMTLYFLWKWTRICPGRYAGLQRKPHCPSNLGSFLHLLSRTFSVSA